MSKYQLKMSAPGSSEHGFVEREHRPGGGAESQRILRLIAPAMLRVDTRLNGPMLTIRDLMAIRTGDVLTFDYPVDRPVNVTLNGRSKFIGRVGAMGRKRAIHLDELVPLDQA